MTRLNLEALILLEIDYMYFDNAYKTELTPIRKYRYYKSLEKIKLIMEAEYGHK